MFHEGRLISVSFTIDARMAYLSKYVDVHAKGGRNVPLCLRARGERCTVMHRGCELETGISLVCFYLSCVE